jgi:two-component system response regulator (stage 0 sporulation protein F)
MNHPLPAPSKGVPRRVLIADDDDDVRDMLATFLGDEGWEVVEAKDGQEALDRLTSEDFHLVMLDQRMPKLTGSEVYLQLAGRGRTAPVILVTAANQIEDLARSLGIRYFLRKPFSLVALLAMLEEVPAAHGYGA